MNWPETNSDLRETGRGSCSPQESMLDFMTVVISVMQVSMSAMIAISNNNNNVNNNNNNNDDNNNNININQDSANFAQMGMVNMMMTPQRKRSRADKRILLSSEQRHLLRLACKLEDRRKKLDSSVNVGLKTLNFMFDTSIRRYLAEKSNYKIDDLHCN